MDKLRYYTYIETLKKFAGEHVLFGESEKSQIISERYKRITELLISKNYINEDLFEPVEEPDAEEIYNRLSLLSAYLKGNPQR